MSTMVSFPEARNALLEQDKPIRHKGMPEGHLIKKNYRPYGVGCYILMMLDAQDNLSDEPVDWNDLFWSALEDEDIEDWEVGK